MSRRFWHVGINVTNLEMSISFYEMVGFKVVARKDVITPAAGRAFMVPGGDSLEFAHMRLGNSEGEALLDLIQWKNPPTTGRAAPSLLEAGLCRFSILTNDIDGEFQRLGEAGVHFLQPPETVLALDGESGWRILFASDPDGTLFHFVELVGSTTPAPLSEV